ncbi:MAG: ferredoxin III, nif-specific [Prochloraceae cyanobacterium]
MATLTSLTRGGQTWEPQFIESIDLEKCLGCGRCYKVCGRDVMMLKAVNEDGEFVEDDDDDDIERKVMIILNEDNCIGCQACSKICPKKCQTFASLAV